MAWLSGWDKRIELKIEDYAGDIGAEVVWFPATVFLTSTQGEEVFVELTTDAEYKKIQFTEADGTSLLYGHMKLFDVSETKGIFTVSADGWTINANTSVFLYYDKDHADNNVYIGATNTAACEAVYNAEYEGVWDMADGADTSHIYDATDNNNDGTKKDPDEPIEAEGKVGQGQENVNDYIVVSDNATLDFDAEDFTVSFLFKCANVTETEIILCKGESGPQKDFRIYKTADDLHFDFQVDNDPEQRVTLSAVLDNTTWHSTTMTYKASTKELSAYFDGAYADKITAAYHPASSAFDLVLMARWQDGITDYSTFFPGLMDEVRISRTLRSVAWIKGEHNSLWDTLFTYGSEEARINALFFGSNF